MADGRHFENIYIYKTYYLREKSSDFYEILYIAADFELDERQVIKNEKVELWDSEFDGTYFLLLNNSEFGQELKSVIINDSSCIINHQFNMPSRQQ